MFVIRSYTIHSCISFSTDNYKPLGEGGGDGLNFGKTNSTLLGTEELQIPRPNGYIDTVIE